MIPLFPEFKNLELSDKEDIEQFTKQFPPYSDFNFVSMWSWDIKEEMMISQLLGNLVVKFTDYLTGDPFYTFLGGSNVTETAQTLLDKAKSDNIDLMLKLIPENSIDFIDNSNNIFLLGEQIDHNDYIFSVESLVGYEGSGMKTQRNTLGSFLRKYPTYEARQIDLADPDIHFSILTLYKLWEANSNISVPHELIALKRCLSNAKNFPIFGVGIFIDGILVGFNINQIDNNDFATCFFAKGDIKYYGIYSVLMNETAKVLSSVYKVKYLNYEQDLGLFNLRKSKMAFNPIYFLKKYCIAMNAQ